MIHFRNRLNFFNVIKSLFYFKKINLLEWKKNDKQISLITSKSSWSILLIGIWVKKLKKKNPVFLVPDYYCNYSLNLLRIFGAQIYFYPITKNFEPNLDSIDLSTKPDVLIATHYFGKEYNFNKVNNYCESKKIWLIEDATHCLKRSGNIGNYGHFVIFSQHKFLPSINGALLLLNEKKLSKFEINSFGPQFMWLKYLDNFILEKNVHIFNNNLRVILNIFYDNFIKVFMREKILNFKENDTSQKKFPSPYIDFFSKKIFSYFSNKLGLVADNRQRCHLIIEHLLNKNLDTKEYEILSNIKFDPYLLMIKSENKINDIYKTLQKFGFAIQTWPDLSAEVNLSSDAHYLRSKLAFIPLNKISKKIIKFNNPINNTLNNSFNINLIECSDREKWVHLSKNVHLNLLQTWEFGNYKNSLSFIKTKRFIINDKNDKIIGFFQVIYYKFFFVKLALINRGPIFQNNLDDDLKKIILQKLFIELKKNIFTYFIFKPELEFTKDNIIFQYKKKFLFLNSLLGLLLKSI